MTYCCNTYQTLTIFFLCSIIIILFGFMGYQYYKKIKSERLGGTLNNFVNPNSPPRNGYQSFESP